ncbi:MAG: T9SS type A sorting domain-containing protein, partial [Salinimicrobium sp.]
LFTIATPAPGIYKETVTVTSEDGSTTRAYNIKVEKPFSFDDIVVQKFNNVLLVNNNPETNGGYKFTSYKWFKNGFLVGTNQYFSEGDNASDQLDSESSYYVEMITEEGEVLRTCSTIIQLRDSYTVVLARNPIKLGEQLELFADFPKEELQTMQLSIHDLNGVLLKKIRSNSKSTTIELPFNIQSGVYILDCKTKTHSKSLKFIVY